MERQAFIVFNINHFISAFSYIIAVTDLSFIMSLKGPLEINLDNFINQNFLINIFFNIGTFAIGRLNKHLKLDIVLHDDFFKLIMLSIYVYNIQHFCKIL